MDINIVDPAVGAATSEVVKKIINKLSKLWSSETGVDQLEKQISVHLTYVASWASQYSFLGVSIPKDARLKTIPLRLTNTPRRYSGRAGAHSSQPLDELKMLHFLEPVILLGDPGSGKTTTIKRLCNNILFESATFNEIELHLPILIVLRELGEQETIFTNLMNILFAPNHFDGRLSHSVLGNPSNEAAVLIAEKLDTLNCLLAIDGLDEVSAGKRNHIESEISLLTRYAKNIKIIVTCRSGDYNRNLDGFSLYEILPLTRSEIKNIARAWIENIDDFLKILDSKPYHDLADRPLLLSYLLFIFNSENDLPQKPSHIYRKVVYRLLREWDEERNIIRTTAYGNFDPDTKIDFLSELSYNLTYLYRKSGFDEDDLLKAITIIAPSYGLKTREYKYIMREIETHTGIIIQSGVNRYEFAHLSIQEYLCANFIVRSPVPNLLKKYLSDYPAPVAVACALSSQPEIFLKEMFENHIIEKFRIPGDFFHAVDTGSGDQLVLDLFGIEISRALISFLSRIELEKPNFHKSPEMGVALLLIMAFYYRRYTADADQIIERISHWDVCQQSLCDFIEDTNYFSLVAITDTTSCIIIDRMFIELYERVCGKWPEENPKSKILPIAMIPNSALTHRLRKSSKTKPPEDILQKIKKNISGTPFCEIEIGNHKFVRNECQICGLKVPDKKPSSIRNKGIF